VSRKPPVVVRRQLSKAHHDLQLADLVLKASTDNAARMAYMACFHAAQAALTDLRGDAPKTHRGLRSQFAKLASETDGLGKDMGRFLARAYQSKQRADYEYEMPIATEQARSVIEGAKDFIARIEAVLMA
jgi:uncharacterized protein (UPF0332 family)